MPSTVPFASDGEGRVVWAGEGCGPMLVGLRLGRSEPDAPGRCDEPTQAALAAGQPIRGGLLVIAGAAQVSGAWRVDAAPHVTSSGHRGVLRRCETGRTSIELRQLLHELRTPVHAIQGFAELIQQQLFGPASHHDRALAAGIAAEAAHILAGLEQIEAFIRLSEGSASTEIGSCDLAALLMSLTDRIETAVGRNCVDRAPDTETPALVAVAEERAERLLVRILAALAAEASANECLRVRLHARGESFRLAIDVPAGVAGQPGSGLFAFAAAPTNAVFPGGWLGRGFALRLASAEAHACGGRLRQEDRALVLDLPRAPLPA